MGAVSRQCSLACSLFEDSVLKPGAQCEGGREAGTVMALWSDYQVRPLTCCPVPTCHGLLSLFPAPLWA